MWDGELNRSAGPIPYRHSRGPGVSVPCPRLTIPLSRVGVHRRGLYESRHELCADMHFVTDVVLCVVQWQRLVAGVQ